MGNKKMCESCAKILKENELLQLTLKSKDKDIDNLSLALKCNNAALDKIYAEHDTLLNKYVKQSIVLSRAKSMLIVIANILSTHKTNYQDYDYHIGRIKKIMAEYEKLEK